MGTLLDATVEAGVTHTAWLASWVGFLAFFVATAGYLLLLMFDDENAFKPEDESECAPIGFFLAIATVTLACASAGWGWVLMSRSSTSPPDPADAWTDLSPLYCTWLAASGVAAVLGIWIVGSELGGFDDVSFVQFRALAPHSAPLPHRAPPLGALLSLCPRVRHRFRGVDLDKDALVKLSVAGVLFCAFLYFPTLIPWALWCTPERYLHTPTALEGDLLYWWSVTLGTSLLLIVLFIFLAEDWELISKLMLHVVVLSVGVLYATLKP